MKIMFDTAGKGFLDRLGDAIIHRVDPHCLEREANARAAAYQSIAAHLAPLIMVAAQRLGADGSEPKVAS